MACRKGKDRTGEIHLTNEGYFIEIIACRGATDVDIKFLYNGFIVCNLEYSNIKRKTVSNPYHPSVYGVGYMGVGNYNSKLNGKSSRIYNIWCNILERSYCEKYKLKKPTYKDVTVCEEWHNFQNFAEWYVNNWKPWMNEKWEIDKDILNRGNKIYSSKNCAFAPPEINALFKFKSGKCYYKDRKMFKVLFSKYGEPIYFGMYKTEEEAKEVVKREKEIYFKEVATKWKSFIAVELYEVIYNWKIEEL